MTKTEILRVRSIVEYVKWDDGTTTIASSFNIPIMKGLVKASPKKKKLVIPKATEAGEVEI